MREWQTSSIGALADAGHLELQTGPFGSQLHSYDYVENGVPVVPTEAIRGRKIEHSVLPKIDRSKARELARHKLLPGDILFARRGVQATGHIGVVREDEEGFICGTGAIRLRVNPRQVEIDAEFLSHVLADISSIEWFKHHAIGATMPNLNEGIIRAFKFRTPPYAEQKEIAYFLSAIDDKIELNRRMNETLEAMAPAIFRDWFVDFGPTRRQMAGATDPVQIMGGLTPDPEKAATLAPLFPPTLAANGLPEGWTREKLGARYSELETGKRPKGGVGNLSAGVPSVGAESIKCVGVFDQSKTKYVERAFFEKMKKGKVRDGDVLVYKDGGKPGELRPAVSYVSCGFPFDEFCINEHVFRIRTRQIPQQVLYCLLSTDDAIWQMRELATGVAQPGLNKTAMESISFNVPAEDALFARCAEFVSPMIDGCNSNARQSVTLAAMRDLLLPKLMSGEIRLRDAEHAVGEAAA